MDTTDISQKSDKIESNELEEIDKKPSYGPWNRIIVIRSSFNARYHYQLSFYMKQGVQIGLKLTTPGPRSLVSDPHYFVRYQYLLLQGPKFRKIKSIKLKENIWVRHNAYRCMFFLLHEGAQIQGKEFLKYIDRAIPTKELMNKGHHKQGGYSPWFPVIH